MKHSFWSLPDVSFRRFGSTRIASLVLTLFLSATFGLEAAPASQHHSPIAVTVLRPQGAQSGATVQLSVSATPAGTLDFQWYFNQTNLLNGATNSTLILSNLVLTSAVNYSVVISPMGIAPGGNVPVISGFSPGAAALGAMVTIVGTNFSAGASNDIVYFGAVKAVVQSASTTNLVVTVPAGATYAPITVTVNGLTAYADSPFLPTFAGSGILNGTSLAGGVDLGSGHGPLRVVAGDLDGDGKPDLAVLNYYDGTVSLYRNISTNGNLTTASFAAPVVLTIAGAGSCVFGLALGDLTGDGRLDIVVADYTLNQISIFQNFSSAGSLTTNSFGSEMIIPVNGNPAAVAIADMDGDGQPEIITANQGGNTVSILRNLGNGGVLNSNSFAAPVNFGTGSNPWMMAIIDMDGDGKPDVVTVNQGDPNHKVSILRNLGGGPGFSTNSFAASVDLAGTDTGEALAVGDLDGDGRPDVVVGAYTGQTLAVYRNESTPGNLTTNTFAAPVIWNVGARVHSIAMGDLDGDGKPDLAVVTELPSQLSLYKNLSTPGSFTNSSLGPQINFLAGNNAVGVAIADLDGDGRPDLVFGNFYDNNLEIYRNVISFGAAPLITFQPTNETVNVGGTASFSVVATGAAPLNYQWSVNGASIAHATNATLILTNVQPSQSGNVYFVTVSNGGGSTVSSNAVLTVNSVSTCDSVPSGIVGWWPGEGNANDMVGGNNGIVVNAGYTNGVVGLAFSFDPENLSYGTYSGVEVPDRPAYMLTNSLTIEGWVRPRGNGYMIFFRGDHRPGLDPYSLSMQGNSNLDFYITQANGVVTNVQATLSYNHWTHVAATLDGSTGKMSLYTNGVLASQLVTSLRPFGALDSTQSPGVGIGNLNDGGNNFPFIGDIDEISLYNRALSLNEIAAIYNAGSAGKCQTAMSPVITVQPTNETAAVGGTATFSVTAAGTTPLSYQWSVNGASIGGATNSTLVLTNAQLSQSGNVYLVTVSNSGGSTVSSNAVLTVSSVSLCDPVPSGIVGWWPGEGDANDIVGTNNGTLQGGVNFMSGEVGIAFNFYGTNAAVFVPASSNLNVGVGPGFTVEAWIKPADVTQLHPIFEWNSGTAFGVHMFITPSGVLFGNVVDTSTGWHQLNSSAGLLVTNQFQHVAMTYDQVSGVATLYCNGQMVAQQNFGSFTPLTSYDLYLGRRPAPAGETCSFAGLLDEPSVYNRALSSNEIAAIYGAGSAGKCSLGSAPIITLQPTNQTVQVGGTATFSVTATGTAPLSYQWSVNGASIPNATNATLVVTNVQLSQSGSVYWVAVTNVVGLTYSSNAVLTVTSGSSCDPVPSGIVGWWPGEGNANDIVAGNNGILPNGGSYTNGEVGLAFNFDGISQYLLVQPTNGALNVGSGGGLTVEGWIKPANLSRSMTIVEYERGLATGNGADVGVGIDINSYPNLGLSPGCLGVNLVDTNDGSHIIGTAGNVLTNGAWQHIALTYDKASGIGIAYVNGIVVTKTNVGSFTPQTSFTNVLFGGRTTFSSVAGPTDQFMGGMDELSLYNRALSSNEIAAIYNAGDAGKCTSVSVPVISGFSPGAAALGATVTIVGTNFSAGASNDIVYFGAVKAVVQSASTTNLVVTVPAGATYAPITVTVNGLTAYADSPFLPTFAGSGILNGTSLAGGVDLGSGHGPLSVVIGDLDGDGKPDVAVVNYYDGTVDVYRNISTNGTLATASFATPVVLTVAGAGSSAFNLSLADLTGDGRLDIVVADYFLNQVSIFQNFSSVGSLTTNSFGSEVIIPVKGNPVSVAVADLDGDGEPDIITADQSSNTVSILRNLGNGAILNSNSFAAPVNFATGPTPSVVMVADMDGDGKLDVITANQSDPSHKVSILRNLGTVGGGFTNSFAPTVDLAGADTATTLAVGDLDGDGKPDVVLGSYTGETIAIYRNTSTPGSLATNSFAAPVVFGLGARVHTVALADLDGDGKPDLAVVTEQPSRLSLFKNLSTPGSFTNSSLGPQINFPAGNNAVGVAIADLDGDGRPDLVFGNFYDNNLEIYRNVISFGAAPIITLQPTNGTVNAGSTASFSVTATGAAPLSYQWIWSGSNVISGATDATLTITNVQTGNTGFYSVIVSNLYGTAISSNAFLGVANALHHFVWSPIPSPRFVNAKFPVTVTALDAASNVFTNFTGRVYFGSTNGVPVNPAVSANFVQGLWSGSLCFSQPASNLVLRADDGTGKVGMANAVTIVNPPTLETAQSEGQALFVWPVTSSNFVLETTAKLSPANWVPVAVAPLQIGDQNLVLLPASSATNGFYHLRFTGQ